MFSCLLEKEDLYIKEIGANELGRLFEFLSVSQKTCLVQSRLHRNVSLAVLRNKDARVKHTQ